MKIGDILSQAFNLDNGLPQGSVLSCILFTLVINSIFDELEEVSKSLFCDDGLFWAVGGDLPTVINTMQRALDRLDEWCTYNGPKISILKTTFGIFTKNTGYIEPQLFFRGTPLQLNDKVKYLGVIFDKGLTWKAHIDDLVERCQQPLNMMRVVSRRDWGGDRTSLKMMYKALVRSRIDYAYFLYSHAAHSHLLKLDRVQYEAIRIIIGNMRCTPLGNLEAEAHILPLDLRRRQMALNYFGKAYRIQGHPVRELYVGYHNYEFYNHRPHNLPVVGRVRNTVIESNIPISRLEKFNMSDLYIPNKAKVRYSLLKNKSTYPEYMFKADFQELITNEYSSYVQIYTDGSKINGECGCAVFVDVDPPIIVKKRLPPTCSIFNAELYALSEALKLV